MTKLFLCEVWAPSEPRHSTGAAQRLKELILLIYLILEGQTWTTVSSFGPLYMAPLLKPPNAPTGSCHTLGTPCPNSAPECSTFPNPMPTHLGSFPLFLTPFFPGSTDCAFPSCSSVWFLLSHTGLSLPCLISYTCEQRALVISGKHPQSSTSTLLKTQNGFQQGGCHQDITN